VNEVEIKPKSSQISEDTLATRRKRHPKPRFRPRDVWQWFARPFELAPRSATSRERESYVKPAQLPYTSRFRARRRAKRLRLRRRLLGILWSKRIGYTLMICVGVLLLLFWAKLAVIYHLPSYMHVNALAQAKLYVVWKSWWFGPTSFDLADYPNVDPLNSLQSLTQQLGHYQDIVTNPQEILFVIAGETK